MSVIKQRDGNVDLQDALEQKGPFLMFIDDPDAEKVGSHNSMRYRESGSGQVR